jgi:hypothetical protein
MQQVLSKTLLSERQMTDTTHGLLLQTWLPEPGKSKYTMNPPTVLITIAKVLQLHLLPIVVLLITLVLRHPIEPATAF